MRRTFLLTLATGGLALMVLGCGSPLPAEDVLSPATPAAQNLPAAPGPTGEPTRGVKKGPGLIYTPVANEDPGIAVTPASAPAAHPPATPTGGPWADWQGDGYEFRYPPTCRVAQRDESLTVGSRIELAVRDSGGRGLLEYVSQVVEKQTQEGLWKLESQQALTLGGKVAQRVDYRFGGTNRYGTAVFVQRGEKTYVWQFAAGGSTCDEASAFEVILASFRFVE